MATQAIITYAGPRKSSEEVRENRKNAFVLHSYLSKYTNVDSQFLYCRKFKCRADFTRPLGLRLLSGEPTLFAFFGHGDRNCICPHKDFDVTFHHLAFILSAAKAPTLVVIDSCESYGLVKHCREQDVDMSKVGIITACSRTRLTSGGWLAPQVIKRWQKRVNFPKIKTPAHSAEDQYTYKDARPSTDFYGRTISRESVSCYQTVRWGARHDHLFFPSKG